MGTIAEKLSYLNDTKTAIKNAIVNKGVAVADTDTFRSYADKVSEIVAKGDYNIEVTKLDDGTQQLDITDAVDKPVDMLQARVDETKSCNYLFYLYLGTNPDIVKRLDTSSARGMRSIFNSCQNLKALDLSNLKTSNVIDMESMFDNCTRIENLDVSSFDTSNVTDMSRMFSYCQTLTSLNLSNFDTRNVTNMAYMFKGCTNLTSLNLSNFDTSSVTGMAYMFADCTNLTSLDVSNFNTGKVTNMNYMFNGCSSLTNLNLNSFDTSNVVSMINMFSNNISLQTILGTIDMIKITNINNTSSMFYSCRKLTDFILKNIKVRLQIGSGTSYGTLLSDTTIINTAKELWDLTGATSQTLTVSTATSAKLDAIYVKLIDVTNEMIANDSNITNKKPCEVCESTDEGAMTLREYIISKNWSISG